MEPAPTPEAKPAAAAAAAPSTVHPAARWVAGLFSPMSLRDQDYCADMLQRIVWGSLAVSFPIAYWLGNILVTVGGVIAAAVVCLVLFVPNWRQRPDPALQYADDTAVYHYYQQYEAAKKAAREKKPKSTATSPTTAAAAAGGEMPARAA